MKTHEAEVLWVARYDYPQGWKMNIPHEHDYYQIIFIIDGKGDFLLEGQTYPIQAGAMFFMRPFRVHQLLSVSSTTLKTYDIKFMVYEQELIAKLDLIDSVLTINYDIPALFKKIREEGIEKKPYYKDFSSLSLLKLLLSMLRAHEDKSSTEELELGQTVEGDESRNMCQSVIAYIKKHYKEELTLTAIADSLGYNQSYICQVFRKKLKYTPMRYLYLYRIEKAKELIAYSDFDLKQIASITGFKTIHHFTRLFHDTEGISPGQWREKEKAGIRKGVFIDDSFKNQNIIRPKI